MEKKKFPTVSLNPETTKKFLCTLKAFILQVILARLGDKRDSLQGSTDPKVCSVRAFSPDGRSKVPLSRPISPGAEEL